MFIELCLSGEAAIDEIDDYVEKWHKSGSSLSLAKYLGLADEEYALWVEKPELLRFIIFARKNDLPLSRVLEARCRTNPLSFHLLKK